MNIFEDFFNLSNDPMTIGDTNGRILHANVVYTTLTGWSVEELKEIPYWELLHPEDHEKVAAALKTLQSGHPVFALEYRFLSKDGSYKSFIANISRNENSGHLYAISRLKEGQIIPSTIFANMAPVAVLIVKTNGMIQYANALAETLFEYEHNALIDKAIEVLIPEQVRIKHKAHRAMYQKSPSTRPMGSSDKLKGLKKSGTEFLVDISLNPLYEENGLVIACSILDITEKVKNSEIAVNLKKENQRLADLAQQDPLTKAYNRRTMDELFPNISRESRKQNKPVSAIMLDIDHFKRYNDEFGHQMGDELLGALVQITKDHIRANDILVRYGGEEFLIIMPNCNQDQSNEAAERIRFALEHHKSLSYKFTASFGVSTYDFQDSQHLEDQQILAKLIEESDKALYHAKRDGRNCVRHFSST